MADRIDPKTRSLLMSRVKQHNTAPEIAVRTALHRRGYRFRLKTPLLPARPDILFPGRKKVVFVHGCFWHGHSCKRGTPPASNREFWEAKLSKNKVRDARVLKELRRMGWRSIVIWECEVKNLGKAVDKLAKFLEQK